MTMPIPTISRTCALALATSLFSMASMGCTVASPEDTETTSSALGSVRSLASLGIPVNNRNQPLPANWNQLKEGGQRLTQAEHICPWAVRPTIYAFTDGVVYADANETNINVFGHDVVRSHGCYVPPLNGMAVQSAFQEPLNPNNTYAGTSRTYEAASLSSYGIAVNNRSHGRDGQFAAIMGKALRISQKDHGCAWASRPLIYVFTDGVAYATVDGNDFNVFDYGTVRSKGCFLPDVKPLGSSVTGPGGAATTTPPAPPPPASIPLQFASATITSACDSAVPSDPSALHVCLRYRSGNNKRFANAVLFEFRGFSASSHETLRNAVGLLGDAIEIHGEQFRTNNGKSDWITCGAAYSKKDFEPQASGLAYTGADVATPELASQMVIATISMALPKANQGGSSTVIVNAFTEPFKSNGSITAGRAVLRNQNLSDLPRPPVITMNTTFVEATGFNARDVADTIFHELGHQMGYTHPTGYEGNMLTEVGLCIAKNFAVTPSASLVSKPSKSCD
jgi:hypothetical protein